MLPESKIAELYVVLQRTWSAETCYPPLRHKWSPDDPTVGQCAATAAAIYALFGGSIAYSSRGNHFWNILPDGTHHDFARAQFSAKEKARLQVTRMVPFSEVLHSASAVIARTYARYSVIMFALAYLGT